jgi:hypothetical protein
MKEKTRTRLGVASIVLCLIPLVGAVTAHQRYTDEPARRELHVSADAHGTHSFEVDDLGGFLVVSVRLAGTGGVDLRLVNPVERTVARWELRAGECSVATGCDVAEEHVVVQQPRLGRFVLHAMAPGNTSMPAAADLEVVALLYPGKARGNDPYLRADNVWWSDPDRRPVFVEDGGYMDAAAYRAALIGWSAAGAVLLLVGLFLLRRNNGPRP